jgi:hypothetical protein
MSYMVELDSLLRPAARNLARLPNDRRGFDRVPIQIPCNELVDDRLHRALAANLSPSGLYVDRVFGAGHDRLQLGREERRVQLEFELPATHESIWALGEICHDDLGVVGGRTTVVHGTGVRFTAMARKHERLIEEFVYEHRRRTLEKLLGRVLERRSNDRRRRDRRAA